jgi:hypothetical protein
VRQQNHTDVVLIESCKHTVQNMHVFLMLVQDLNFSKTIQMWGWRIQSCKDRDAQHNRGSVLGTTKMFSLVLISVVLTIKLQKTISNQEVEIVVIEK